MYLYLKYLLFVPRCSTIELERLYNLALHGSDEEKSAAAKILCGASLIRGWNIQVKLMFLCSSKSCNSLHIFVKSSFKPQIVGRLRFEHSSVYVMLPTNATLLFFRYFDVFPLVDLLSDS